MGRFDDAKVVSVLISGTGLTESSFNFTNTGSADDHIGAHVQGIPGSTGPRGAIKDSTVPEPSSLALAGMGLGVGSLVGLRRRWRRQPV